MGSPTFARTARWLAAFAFAACLSTAGGFIVLPVLILRMLFLGVRRLGRWLESVLFPDRVAARALVAALPTESHWDDFGSGRRRRLTAAMRSAVKTAFPHREWIDLAQYSYEERPSLFPGARSDVVVYDLQGRTVLRGRKPAEGRIAFWLSPDS